MGGGLSQSIALPDQAPAALADVPASCSSRTVAPVAWLIGDGSGAFAMEPLRCARCEFRSMRAAFLGSAESSLMGAEAKKIQELSDKIQGVGPLGKRDLYDVYNGGDKRPAMPMDFSLFALAELPMKVIRHGKWAILAMILFGKQMVQLAKALAKFTMMAARVMAKAAKHAAKAAATAAKHAATAAKHVATAAKHAANGLATAAEAAGKGLKAAAVFAATHLGPALTALAAGAAKAAKAVGKAAKWMAKKSVQAAKATASALKKGAEAIKRAAEALKAKLAALNLGGMNWKLGLSLAAAFAVVASMMALMDKCTRGRMMDELTSKSAPSMTKPEPQPSRPSALSLRGTRPMAASGTAKDLSKMAPGTMKVSCIADEAGGTLTSVWAAVVEARQPMDYHRVNVATRSPGCDVIGHGRWISIRRDRRAQWNEFL